MLGNRLARQKRHHAGWARAEGVTCFRLYERDIPEWPLIVDWYDGDVVAWLYERTRDDTPTLREAFRAAAVAEILAGLQIPPERLWLKDRRGQGEGGQYTRVDGRHAVRTVMEQGLRFEVNLSDYLDTGLFLDHRRTRAMIRHYAAGKRVLNLFAYTGSFTVYARAGGAVATTTVDMSRTYQAWTRRNLELNDMAESAAHRLVEADCLAWLSRGPAPGEAYDLVVCDPPTFSNSKRMEIGSFAIDRDYPMLIGAILPFLAPGGYLYFSTNSRGLRWDESQLPPGLAVKELSWKTVPPDFRNARIHRSWRLERSGVSGSAAGTPGRPGASPRTACPPASPPDT